MDSIRIDLPQLCRACFILATTAAIIANSVPSLRKAWVVYGSRRTDVPHGTPQHLRFLDYAGGFQVPHSWFTSFYIVSMSSSIFWAFQIVARGHIFKFLVSHSTDPAGVPTGMTINQVVIAWTFMALHGTRRLYESISLNKPSQAMMPIMGWAVGIAFYLGVGLSVWVEGIPLLLENHLINGIVLSKPSLKTTVAVTLFLLASGIQHRCHKYLASLKKYTLPEFEPFRWVLCPHYTCECIIYLALALVAAPDGQVLNKTISTALLFAVVNLGITAESSRIWCAQKFGAKAVARRWRMIPLVY